MTITAVCSYILRFDVFEFCIKKENHGVIHIVIVLQIYQSELYKFVKATLTNFDYQLENKLYG